METTNDDAQIPAAAPRKRGRPRNSSKKSEANDGNTLKSSELKRPRGRPRKNQTSPEATAQSNKKPKDKAPVSRVGDEEGEYSATLNAIGQVLSRSLPELQQMNGNSKDDKKELDEPTLGMDDAAVGSLLNTAPQVSPIATTDIVKTPSNQIIKLSVIYG